MFPGYRRLTLASALLSTLVAAPAVSPAQETEPPDDQQSGGLARTEGELGALGRLAETPEPTEWRKARDARLSVSLAVRPLLFGRYIPESTQVARCSSSAMF